MRHLFCNCQWKLFSCDRKLRVLRARIHGLWYCIHDIASFNYEIMILWGFANQVLFCCYPWKSKYWQNSKLLFVLLQLFQGNYDRNSDVKHVLVDGVLAKYLRFLPKTHHNRICMRTEVFGVKLEPGRDFNVTQMRFKYCLCYIVDVFPIY